MKVSRILVLGLCVCGLQSCRQTDQTQVVQGDYPLLTLKAEDRTLSVKSLLNTRLNVESDRFTQLQSIITLYHALGGGTV